MSLNKVWNDKGTKIDCKICSVIIKTSPSRLGRKKYCSKKCFGDSRKLLIKEKHPNWKGGRKIAFRRYLVGWLKTDKGKEYRKRQNSLHRLKISETEQDDLKRQYDYHCLMCGLGEPEIELTIDHVLPASLGGEDELDNYQPLCRSCNSSKGTKTIDFRGEYKLNNFYRQLIYDRI